MALTFESGDEIIRCDHLHFRQYHIFTWHFLFFNIAEVTFQWSFCPIFSSSSLGDKGF